MASLVEIEILHDERAEFLHPGHGATAKQVEHAVRNARLCFLGVIAQVIAIHIRLYVHGITFL